MIRSLRVRNLAVIEELELELGPGLHVVTGETGAGKSVLLSAIALLCGRRVSSDQIRAGESEASVEAVLDSAPLVERARELGLCDDDVDELLVRRSISREGRGRVHVNGRLATVAVLAELLADAIEVVSQGEHQRLLRPDVQTGLLDTFGGLDAELGAVRSAYGTWRTLAHELRDRIGRTEERTRRADQLRFEIDQIDAVEPRAGEQEELDADHARLAHVDRLVQHAQVAVTALDGESGARDALAGALRETGSGAELDPKLRDVADALRRGSVELEEASLELERYQASLEADPARLEHTERRIAELARLTSRYGASVEAVLEYRDNAREELSALGGGEARTAELEAELDAASRALEHAAAELSAGRARASRALEAEVAQELDVLALAKARFTVELEPMKSDDDRFSPPAGPEGADRATFLLAANPGEEARRLRDAASGGELSRLQLALRNALRGADGGHLLLFDEIDAGVGGKTARRVGERLLALGTREQILCITHLPPIAALGSTHYHVEKRTRGGRTRTRVERLEADRRVEEIARMSSGGRVTDVARAHARELLGARPT